MATEHPASRPQHALTVAVERSRGATAQGLPRRAVESATLSLLDWLGCAVAGAATTDANRARRALGPGAGGCVVVGTGLRTGWRDAVVLNGIQGHVLDFDDMLPALSGHPSAAVLPALLTLGADRGATVADAAEALAAGVEVASWVARSVMPEHYDAGWHGTGTVGSLAAAGAVAHLLDLDRDQWVAALDLAATQASGLRELFGTAGKPLHAANAAQAGAVAARMAAAGAVSGGQGLVGRKGFIAIHGGDLEAVRAPGPGPWAIEGTLYKTYASCFMTQAVVDAARQLRERVATTDHIEAIEVTVSPKLKDVCAIEDPVTGLDAKFSIHATTALALLGYDMAAEHTYHPERLAGDGYRNLRSRISLAFDEALAGREPRATMRATLASGEHMVHEVDRGRPAADVGLLRETLQGKFTSLVAPVLGAERAAQLVRLAGAGQTPLASLLAAAGTTTEEHHRMEPAAAGTA
jgi:2-methylcitrate dehydratase PrpD